MAGHLEMGALSSASRMATVWQSTPIGTLYLIVGTHLTLLSELLVGRAQSFALPLASSCLRTQAFGRSSGFFFHCVRSVAGWQLHAPLLASSSCYSNSMSACFSHESWAMTAIFRGPTKVAHFFRTQPFGLNPIPRRTMVVTPPPYKLPYNTPLPASIWPSKLCP